MDSLIFDIQRFSIHDGEGIRTVVFLKGCNLNCPWCQNPESIDHRPEMAFYSDKCIRAGDCADVCEVNAISIGSPSHIDRAVCTRCGKCAEACVTGAIKRIGKTYSVAQLVEEILKDEAYYRTSGGGVTFSGGEPSIHADFILPVLRECKLYGIHTNIETNGYFKWEKFSKLLPFLDLIYFDLKIIDSERNKSLLGGDSERILANMERLIQRGTPVEFRIPLIPGHTDDDANLTAMIALLHSKGVSKIHLLPYHSMGEAKAARICSPLPGLGKRPFTAEQIAQFQSRFEQEHIRTELYR